MKLEIENSNSYFYGIAGAGLARIVLQLEGRKQWIKNPKCFKFETSEHNIRLFKANMPNAEYIDHRKPKEFIAQIDFGQDVMDKAVLDESFEPKTNNSMKIIDWEDDPVEFSVDDEIWPFKVKPYDFQMQCFRKLRDVPNHAIFAAPGTGKTKMKIDIDCRRYMKGQIELILVFSWPKGVHHQWIEDELPKHCWDLIEWDGASWNGKEIPEILFKRNGKLKIFSTNIESVNSPKALSQIKDLMKVYEGKISIVIDESQKIKNPSSKRSQRIMELGEQARFRTCLTGTPIANDLRDEWGQFMFLDKDIIGIKYKTSFQAMYCIMGGYENSSVLQHRNVDHFKKLVAPYQYRVSKEPLGLPPMITDELTFTMSDEQKKLQDELKKTFTAMLDNGEIVSVVNAASMFIRLQQIASGYAVDENGVLKILKSNPRMDALERLVSGIDGKKVIWCRFKQDIEFLMKIYGERAMHYYGPTKPHERKEAIKRFTDVKDDLEFLIASPAAAGAGLNLQGACNHAIFYTNSFNFIDREQAESRIHRIGTKSTVFNFDIIARGSVDRHIINNLRRKKNFSDFVLDDVKGILNEF